MNRHVSKQCFRSSGFLRPQLWGSPATKRGSTVSQPTALPSHQAVRTSSSTSPSATERWVHVVARRSLSGYWTVNVGRFPVCCIVIFMFFCVWGGFRVFSCWPVRWTQWTCHSWMKLPWGAFGFFRYFSHLHDSISGVFFARRIFIFNLKSGL